MALEAVSSHRTAGDQKVRQHAAAESNRSIKLKSNFEILLVLDFLVMEKLIAETSHLCDQQPVDRCIVNLQIAFAGRFILHRRRKMRKSARQEEFKLVQ